MKLILMFKTNYTNKNDNKMGFSKMLKVLLIVSTFSFYIFDFNYILSERLHEKPLMWVP